MSPCASVPWAAILNKTILDSISVATFPCMGLTCSSLRVFCPIPVANTCANVMRFPASSDILLILFSSELELKYRMI